MLNFKKTFHLLIQLFMGIVCLSLHASAQISTEMRLKQAVERDVRGLIERHIPADSFQIFVTLTPKKTDTASVPYVPDRALSGGANGFGGWEPLVDLVQIEVLLANRYNSSTRGKLKEILEKKLPLSPARGDQVTFSNLGIDVAPVKSDLEAALARAEAAVRDAKSQADAREREREDAKRELALANAELERLRSSSQPDKTSDGQSSALSVDTLRYGAIIFVVISLIAIVFGGLTLRGAAKQMATALSQVGENLPLLGEKLSEGIAAGRDSRSDQTNKLMANDRSPPAALLPQGSKNSSIPPESLQKRILTLHEEIISALNQRTETLVLIHISHLLANPESVGKAVASMEILGKDKANELYHKLGPEQRLVVQDFLTEGTHQQNKSELMIEAGEELKTKLLGESFEGVRGKISDDVAAMLLKLQKNDLVALVKDASFELLPRLFLYLDPLRLGEILSELMNVDKKRFEDVIQHIAKMPEITDDLHLDKDILDLINERLDMARSDRQRLFLPYYKSLIENVDEAAAEYLSETLIAGGRGLANYIRDNVVTFGTFLRLSKEIKEEIVDSMANKDFAALVVGLPGDTREEFMALLNNRRRELMKEEIDRAQEFSARQLEVLHRSAKASIVRRILELKGSNPLSHLLVRAEESQAQVDAESDNNSQAA